MRSGRAGRVVGGVLLAGALMAPAITAQAQEGEERRAENVEMSDESWFYRFRNLPREAPEDPQGGPAGPALGTLRDETNVYDAVPPGGSTQETLHVGVVAGQPEARMFLGLPTFQLLGPDEDFGDVIITGGQITLTDAGPTHGSRAVDTADMIACYATELIVGGRGGDWPDLPGFDCAIHAPLERVEDSDPAQFTIDLAPFAGAFADNPQAQGLAIVERLVLDAGDEQPRPPSPESWHLAVHSNLTCFTDAEGVPGEDDIAVDGQNCVMGAPITADLTYRVAALDVGFEVIDGEPSSGDDLGGFDDGFTGEPPADGFDDGFTEDLPAGGFAGGFDEGFDEGFADGGPPAVEVGEPVALGSGRGGDAGRGAGSTPMTAAGGVATTPGVYLLGLLGLGMAGLLGYSLTRAPELPVVREGAVSQLMKIRGSGDGPLG